MAILLTAAAILLLRTASAALAALRTLVMARGDEAWAAFLGFFEVLVYVLSLGYVVSNLSNVPVVLGYCLGFSLGTVFGMRIERRLALGFVSLRIVSVRDAASIAQTLRDEGMGATVTHGEGRDGGVGIVECVVTRRSATRAHQLVGRIDPNAFVVFDEAHAVHAGWLPRTARSLLGEQK